MSENSVILALPYIQPSQAQKHVTHNEALQKLDVLVQLVVAGFDAETPPSAPAEGDVYALGINPIGVWSGQAGTLAAWVDSVWVFIPQQQGWRAWDSVGQDYRVWDGSAWVRPPADLQNVDGVGIGTTSDPVNRLAVSAEATLLSHAGAGHQLKINKAVDTDTGSLLFQSGWMGHAEMGLAGNTDFSIKVSPDGTVFSSAMVLDATTGEASFLGIENSPIGQAAPAVATFSKVDVDDQAPLISLNETDSGFGAGLGTSAARFALTALQAGVDNGDIYSVGLSAAGAVTHQWFTSGSRRMTLDASGYIGIGTPAPVEKLHVVGNVKVASVGPSFLWDENDASADAGHWSLRAQGEELYFQALSDAGSGGGGMVALSRTAQNITNLIGRWSGTDRWSLDNQNRKLAFLGGNGIVSVDGTYSLVSQIGGVEGMRLNSTGLGIGTNIPAFKLHVAESDAASVGARISATSAAYTGTVMQLLCITPGANTFNLAEFYSGGTGDMEFKFSGDGNGTCDGAWTGGGADYAEFFEWADGNPGNEDRRGISVVLVGDKMREAMAGEEPIGVISGNPSVVGDGDIGRWKGKYLRDDFGTVIMEDCEVVEWVETITEETGDVDEAANPVMATRQEQHSFATDRVPDGLRVPADATRSHHQRRRLNPAHDPQRPYTPRADRVEWDTVGLMGKLRLRTGQVTGARWIRMGEVSADVELWLVR